VAYALSDQPEVDDALAGVEPICEHGRDLVSMAIRYEIDGSSPDPLANWL